MTWVRNSKLIDAIWQYGPATPQPIWLPEPIALAIMAAEEQVDRLFDFFTGVSDQRPSGEFYSVAESHEALPTENAGIELTNTSWHCDSRHWNGKV